MEQLHSAGLRGLKLALNELINCNCSQCQQALDRHKLSAVIADLDLFEHMRSEQSENEQKQDHHPSPDLLNLSEQACLTTSVKGIVQSADATASQMLGQPAEHLLSKPLPLFFSREHTIALYKVLSAFRKGAIARVSDIVMKVQGQAGKVVSLTGTAVEENGLLNVRWSIVDLNAQSKQEREILRLNEELQVRLSDLSKARDEAQDAVHAKTQFIANMSHELRTPLNGVVGMSDILLRTDLDSEQLECATIIRESAKNILALVEDILDVAKIDIGGVAIHSRDFDLRNAMEDIVASLSEQANQKGLSLMLYVDAQLPQIINADVLRLRQILLNLLSNAIKFTNAGEITVRVSGSKTGDKIRLTVADTGGGISQKGMDLLFKPFSQVDSSNTREQGGSGLGLFISKRLVELMGGRIGVFSKVGQGSTFWFTLPVPLSKAAVSSSTALGLLQNQEKNAAQRGVLIISRFRQSRNILGRYIGELHLPCISVSSPAEAEAVMDRAVCNYVIVDLGMPTDPICAWLGKETDGGSLHNKNLIIVAPDSELARRTVTPQFPYEYLSKPVRKLQLFEALQSGSRPQESPRAPKENNPGRQEESEPNAQVTALVVDDNAVNRRVTALLLKKLGYSCHVAENGQQAVEAYANYCYPLIFMDCQMPVMDGYQATAAIRRLAQDSSSSPCIVALTANVLPDTRDKCLQAGMNNYLSKPVTLHHLSELVSSWRASLES